MRAPEKIYLQICGECKDDDCQNCKFTDLEGNVTWCVDKIFDKDFEYVKVDAFISKACKWLRNNSHNYSNNALGKEYLVNDFENYMKGE